MAEFVYRIPRWNETFENAKSRGYAKCSYVCMPNKQDGLGLQRILAEEDGASIFGIWCLILQACSRQGKHRDGWLTDDGHVTGEPWGSDDLAFRWRRKPEEVERALSLLSSDKVGWLKKIQQTLPNLGSASPDADSKEGRKEGKKERDSAQFGQNAETPPPPSVSLVGGKKTPWKEGLRRLLMRFDMSANPTDLDEWYGAIKTRAKCKDWAEVEAFFAWVQNVAIRERSPIKHRRHAGTLPEEWDEHARAIHFKPEEAAL
jgi:hypothetical protein